MTQRPTTSAEMPQRSTTSAFKQQAMAVSLSVLASILLVNYFSMLLSTGGQTWSPILTHQWVVGTFFLVGTVFVPIGLAIFFASGNIEEVRVTLLPNAAHVHRLM